MPSQNWEAQRMRQIPYSGIRKIFQAATELEKEGKKVIHLELGRPDFDTPRHIKEAAKQALDDGLVHYTSNYGLPELRQAIAEKLRRDNGVEVDPDTEIIVTVGAGEAIFMITTALLDPDDEVLTPDLFWLNYQHCPHLSGARVKFVPMREENNFQLDPADLEKAITPKSKLLFLNTPHNPTGVVFNRETVEAVAHIAQKHNLLVISDEMYEKIIYDGARHASIGALPGMAERTLTVNGFSKAYSMTGWRLGYVAGPKALIDPLLLVHQYSVTCATSFAQKGAVAAYRGPQEPVQEMVDEFDRRRKFLVKALEQLPGVRCVRPQGAFYTFPAVEVPGMNAEELAFYLLREAHVGVVPGTAFGRGEGYLRLSYANSYENLEEGMARIEKALRQLS